MSLLLWIVIFCLLGGILSVMAASVFLLLPERVRINNLPHFVSFAIGALLGAAFLALLPHAITSPHAPEVHEIGLTILIGVLAFFVLEKILLWRHCHHETCEAHGTETQSHNHAAGSMILIGDAMHNFVDGILIAAAFMTDIDLGIVTAVAVAAHEIPQEVGDFAVLLHSGFTRRKALFFNLLSTLGTLIGGIIAYYSLSGAEHFVPYILAVAAASFIYIAVADLIPGLHKHAEASATVKQVLLIVAGVVVIFFAHSTLH